MHQKLSCGFSETKAKQQRLLISWNELRFITTTAATTNGTERTWHCPLPSPTAHINIPKSINHSISSHTLLWQQRHTEAEAECRNKSAKRQKDATQRPIPCVHSRCGMEYMDIVVCLPQSINFKPKKWMSKLSFGSVECGVRCVWMANVLRVCVSERMHIILFILRVNILSNIQQWVLVYVYWWLCCALLVTFFPSVSFGSLSPCTPISKISTLQNPCTGRGTHNIWCDTYTVCK